MSDRFDVTRTIAAPGADIFAVLCDPQGHVAIDSSGMLQDADGDLVRAAGDTFVVHMDRASLNDVPTMGMYDVTVCIQDFDENRLISWTVSGGNRPPPGHVDGYRLDPAPHGDGTVVTSFYDWSQITQRYRGSGAFRFCRRMPYGQRSASSTAPYVTVTGTPTALAR